MLCVRVADRIDFRAVDASYRSWHIQCKRSITLSAAWFSYTCDQSMMCALDVRYDRWSSVCPIYHCYLIYNGSDDDYDEGDDNCETLFHCHIILHSYVHCCTADEHANLLHVEYIPTIAGSIRSLERGTTPVLSDPRDASPLTHGRPLCTQFLFRASLGKLATLKVCCFMSVLTPLVDWHFKQQRVNTLKVE